MSKMNLDGDVLYSGDELELRAAVCDSGRLGIEFDAAHATSPHEPEVIQAMRDILSAFLIDNGYE